MNSLSDLISSSNPLPAFIIPSKPENLTLTISYRQFHTHLSSFQQSLAKLGVKDQDAVTIILPNSYEFAVTFLAVCRQRAIAAPLNHAYKEDEFEFYVKDIQSVLIVVPRGAFAQNHASVRAARRNRVAVAECFWDGREVVLELKYGGNLAEGKEVDVNQKAQPSDVALVLHTSGTTAKPKAVPLTHQNLLQSMGNIRNTYTLTPNDRTLLVMPIFHVHGLLAGFLAPLLSGGSIIIVPRFSASDFWNTFSLHGANWYTAVPTIHQLLLLHPVPEKLPKIRFIRSCSAPLSPTTFHELEKKFNAPVLEAYAMTEAAHQISSNPLPPAQRRPGSIGVGQGVEVKILDEHGDEVPFGTEAEICIRGLNVTKGYLHNEEANRTSFTKGNFFRTGDQGKQDKEGYIVLTGRIKELINKGGEKISPVEIDNVVTQHPSVAEAVSFAITDKIYGQDIGIAVVLKDQESLTQCELRRWIQTKVVAFKVPKEIFFTSHMPRTATGKIQRKAVAATFKDQIGVQAKL